MDKMNDLDKSISNLSGVGPKMEEKLGGLGIETIRDLIFYYPRRYDDFTSPRNIAGLRINDEVIIKGEIVSIAKAYTKRRWMTLIEAILKDLSADKAGTTGEIKAVWFNQPFLLNILKPGDTWLFAGKVGWDFKKKQKNLAVTQYEKDGKIFAVYPETEGLTSKFLRKLLQPIISDLELEDYLPLDIIKSENLMSLEDAIRNIHAPEDNIKLATAKKRIAFDELFLIALKMLQSKKELTLANGIEIDTDEKLLQDFVGKLPYKLTNAQRKTAWEIICDLKKKTPMNRLLEGDVGSGKTVVAAMAVLAACHAGYQSVWLAPTEILANQHFQNVTKLLKPFKIKVGLFTAANKLADLAKDDLIIGTHALIQKNIEIKNLALIIVDEQHRFGVKQRAFLRSTVKNSRLTVNGERLTELVPHFLSMTATPIPRTLALAFYGDLDLSIIDEMPKGRRKIKTQIVAPVDREKAYEFIKNQITSGRQVFVICPLIEEKETLNKNLFEADRKSAVAEYNKLSKEIFPKFSVGLLHGKMKSKEKEEVMGHFKTGKIDILVSTAVVEVGIDIANATVMMIESAERFGLAQLHQFRGRVGRGEHLSFCFLFSDSWSETTKTRLDAMTTCDNGFDLAQIDLDLRGPGEMVGLRQSGLPDLKMASLSDRMLIEATRRAAQKVVAEGIEKYPSLQKKYQKFMATKHLE